MSINQIPAQKFGHFMNSLYLCRCDLMFIDTKYIGEKDALHRNGREYFTDIYTLWMNFSYLQSS